MPPRGGGQRNERFSCAGRLCAGFFNLPMMLMGSGMRVAAVCVPRTWVERAWAERATVIHGSRQRSRDVYGLASAHTTAAAEGWTGALGAGGFHVHLLCGSLARGGNSWRGAQEVEGESELVVR